MAVLAALPMAGCLARAEILLTPSNPSVVSGQQCKVKATRSDGKAPEWRWQVVEPGGGHFLHDPDGRVYYVAPEVARPRVFHLQVQDQAHPDDARTVKVHVLPRLRIPLDAESPASLPGTPEDDSTEALPRMTLFAGTDHPDPGVEAPLAFDLIAAIRFVEDPTMNRLNRHWLIADGKGLKTVSSRGVTATFAGIAGPVSALAVRPVASLRNNPLHVVFAQAETSRPGRSAFADRADLVWALDPDGVARVLAGTSRDEHLEPMPFRDGPGEHARFGAITGLAMAADGTVYVADRGNRLIRKITKGGEVSTLAGRTDDQDVRDGLGPAASFGALRAMALDPMTGNLYVSDMNAIRKITPEGRVSTLLGDFVNKGFQSPEGHPVPSGLPCLDHPSGLQVQGGNLFIADTGNHAVRVFNLKTRVLRTLVGHPSQDETRLGPVGLFSPALPKQACAAVHEPEDLAITADGTCLVGLGNGLLRLSCLPLAQPAPEGIRSARGASR